MSLGSCDQYSNCRLVTKLVCLAVYDSQLTSISLYWRPAAARTSPVLPYPDGTREYFVTGTPSHLSCDISRKSGHQYLTRPPYHLLSSFPVSDAYSQRTMHVLGSTENTLLRRAATAEVPNEAVLALLKPNPART